MKKGKIIALFVAVIVFITGLFIVKATGNVEVKEVKVKDKSSTITVADPVLNNGEITSNISFNEEGDYVLFDVTLKNNKDSEYKIKSVTDNNENSNLKIEYDYDEKIGVGGTGSLKIKMTYKTKLVNEDINISNLVITIEDESGNKDRVIVNPLTKDNIIKYLLLLLISIVGIVFILRRKKASKILMVIMATLLMIPTVVIAAENLTIKFTSIDIKGEFEVFTVTIDPGDGSAPEEREVKYGDEIGELPDVSKEGYTFVRWKDQDGNTVTEDTVITGELSIEPEFTANKYNVIFDANGGSGNMNSQEMTYDETANLNANSFANGDKGFKGWNTEADGSGDPYDDEAEVKNLSTKDDITLYAQWEKVAILDTGTNVNIKMKNLANDTDDYESGWEDFTITKVLKTTTLPDGYTPSEATTITLPESEEEIYIWWDSDNAIMYWYAPSNIDRIVLTDASHLFEELEYAEEIDFLDKLDLSQSTTMSYMFSYCSLTDISGVADWDVSNVTDMRYLFASNDITDITALHDWTTSEVTDMSGMLIGTKISSTEALENWEVSNVTDMSRLFAFCDALTDLSGVAIWETDNVRYMSYLFQYCQVLTDLSALESWNVSSVISMEYMFYNCPAITNLQSLHNWNVSNVQSFNGMFMACYALEDIDGISNWNMSGATGINSMFSGCSRASGTITIRSLMTNIGYAFDGAATVTGAQIVVNYTSAVTNIDQIIATKSSNSNVVKGSLVS